jgi:hypothetical protein
MFLRAWQGTRGKNEVLPPYGVEIHGCQDNVQDWQTTVHGWCDYPTLRTTWSVVNLTS